MMRRYSVVSSDHSSCTTSHISRDDKSLVSARLAIDAKWARKSENSVVIFGLGQMNYETMIAVMLVTGPWYIIPKNSVRPTCTSLTHLTRLYVTITGLRCGRLGYIKA